ncbi:hypothetical protein [Lewinella sp. W8]|uniref:hypothetical protein n=1 Tax=Lewinella sp. W8 TaxID=2528208 RepID=UPI0010676F82|nr:hypothetical protein [Lewinella sp. W8]MTB53563.1 hypothetical protein [Lewinella sp. W8]
MRHYFELQFRRISRQLRDWGVPPVAALLLAPVAFFLLASMLMERTEFAPYLLLAFGTIPLAQLGGQARNDFLFLQFHQSTYRKIRLAENGLLVAPFLLFFLVRGLWGMAFLQLLLGLVMVFLPALSSVNRVLPTPFSREPFEFAVGIRKTWFGYLGCCFLAVMGHQSDNYSLMVFAMVLPAFVAMGYYGKPEPAFFLWIHTLSPQDFLNRKLRMAARHAFILLLPLLLYVLYAFPEEWWLTLSLTLLGLAYILLMVVAKYAAYPEEIDLRRAFLMAVAMIIPPLMIVAFVLFYRQARAKLMLFLP